MSEMVRKILTGVVKSIDENAKRVTAVVSTASVDRDLEIILPSAFAKTLPIYLEKAPTFLWGHRWSGDPEDIMGQAVGGAVLADALELEFEYDTDINSKALLVFSQVKRRSVRCYSVGFYPIKYVTSLSSEVEKAALPPDVRKLLDSGRCRRVYTEVELVETSQVPIGSNRDALVAAAAGQRAAGEDGIVKMMHPALNDVTARLRFLAYNLEEATSYWSDELELATQEHLSAALTVLDGIRDSLATLIPAAPETAPESPEVVVLLEPATEAEQKADDPTVVAEATAKMQSLGYAPLTHMAIDLATQVEVAEKLAKGIDYRKLPGTDCGVGAALTEQRNAKRKKAASAILLGLLD